MLKYLDISVQFSSVKSLSRVRLFATPLIAARQASLSITNSQSSLKLTSIESVMPSNHLILCHPLLFLLPIPPSIRVFSNESTLRMRWPKYWSFRFSIIPSKEHPGLISFRMDWLNLLAVQGALKSLSNTTVQKHQFFGAQLSLQSNSHIHTWLLEKPGYINYSIFCNYSCRNVHFENLWGYARNLKWNIIWNEKNMSLMYFLRKTYFQRRNTSLNT